MTPKGNFLPFEEARAYVHSLGFKTSIEYRNWCNSGLRPDNIPYNPNKTYKDKGWISYGDWLGTGNVHLRDREYLTYEEAEKFAHSLGFKKQQEWYQWSKSGKKPINIPVSPCITYKNKGWVSWAKWLRNSTDRLKIPYLPYEEAKAFVNNLGLSDSRAWSEYCTSGLKPDNIPSSPSDIYKDKGYVNLGEWLGNGNVRPEEMYTFYASIEEAKEYAKTLNLRNREQWRKYNKKNTIPSNIPKWPESIYRDRGWVGWEDFLGVVQYVSYEEAREYMKTLGLKREKDWREYKKNHTPPDNIPPYPEKTYRDKGWISWGDYLSTGNIHLGDVEYITLEELKQILKTNNIKNHEQYHKFRKANPELKIPSHPYKTYNRNNLN
jgi:hypothetical protein